MVTLQRYGKYKIVVTCVRVADGGMTVTVTRDARRERTTASWFVSRTRCARFAELSDVSFWTSAHLHPVSRQPWSAAPGRLKRNVVQESDACSKTVINNNIIPLCYLRLQSDSLGRELAPVSF